MPAYSQVVLIDFSNAMSEAETRAYHDTFDVQTLGYRAPELLFGLPFDAKIDMWSLGVTLAELFSGRALVVAASRGGLASEYAQLLGRPPTHFAQGKLAAELLALLAHIPEAALSRDEARRQLAAHLGTAGAPASAAAASSAVSSAADAVAVSATASTSSDASLLLDLITRLLAYDPAERPSALQALCHPFIAPVFPFGAVLHAGVPSAAADAATADAATVDAATAAASSAAAASSSSATASTSEAASTSASASMLVGIPRSAAMAAALSEPETTTSKIVTLRGTALAVCTWRNPVASTPATPAANALLCPSRVRHHHCCLNFCLLVPPPRPLPNAAMCLRVPHRRTAPRGSRGYDPPARRVAVAAAAVAEARRAAHRSANGSEWRMAGAWRARDRRCTGPLCCMHGPLG